MQSHSSRSTWRRRGATVGWSLRVLFPFARDEDPQRSKLLKQETSGLTWAYFLAVHKVDLVVTESDELVK